MMSRHVLIDTHTHLYPVFDPQQWLTRASQNMAKSIAALSSGPTAGALCLTEIERFDDLRRLEQACGPGCDGWTVRQIDGLCWDATHPTCMDLRIFLGRQLVSDEGIEVLALLCDTQFAKHLSVSELLSAVTEAQGIGVLPWGFGKWLGRRGKRVRDLLDVCRPAQLMLGDNGGRPQGLPIPALLRRGRRAGFAVLPGSDPLPLPHEVARVGSSAALFEGSLNAETPSADLRGLLAHATGNEPQATRRKPMATFVRDQVTIQLHNRLPLRKSSSPQP